MSPIVLKYLGYVGSFVVGMTGPILAITYLCFCVREPLITHESNQLNEGGAGLIEKLILKPFLETFKCLFKKRINGLRFLLFLVFFNYGIYLFSIEGRKLEYLFMLRQFKGFTSSDYAFFKVIMQLSVLFNLFVMVPIFSKYLQFHETLLLSAITGCSSMSYYFAGKAVSNGEVQVKKFCSNLDRNPGSRVALLFSTSLHKLKSSSYFNQAHSNKNIHMNMYI